MTATDRPLHPNGMDEVFMHPIKGYVIRYPDTLPCWVNDPGKGAHEDDTNIYVGVEVFRARNELGAWLTKCHPDPEHKLLNHMFVEEVFPCDFEGEDAAAQAALLGRVEMVGDVIDAGGACTICKAPNIEGDVEHLVGCEYMSYLMYRVAQMVFDANGEPSLSEVVRAANEQIARMQ